MKSIGSGPAPSGKTTRQPRRAGGSKTGHGWSEAVGVQADLRHKSEDAPVQDTLVQARPADGSTDPAASGNNIILAFIGENENGILRSTSEDFMALLHPHGFSGHIINLAEPEWYEQLCGFLDQGVLFAWGPAGIGADVRVEGVSLWDRVRVPFISVMADTPCQLPKNHHVAGRYVANGYLFHDWLRMQRRLIRSPQISAMLPLGIMANAACDDVPWSQRQHRMVFVKTGCAPAAHRAGWSGLPRRHIAIIEDAVAAALQNGVGDISDIVLQSVEHHDLYLEGRPEILFHLMSRVDAYVRDYRSTAMVEALLDLPVDIIGRGWDHIETPGCRAKFYKAVDATMLPNVYANTQFLLNTMPNFSTRTHERVLNGFAAKACVITNENADMCRDFGALPSYFGVSTEDTDLTEKLASLYHDTTNRDDQFQPALDLVQSQFSPEAFMCAMIELATEVKAAAGAAFAPYVY
jgi:hypothetical protein